MDNILIFGAGYVAGKFKDALPHAVITKTDITDGAAVARELEAHTPDVVINCAGKTGRPNVDWCETHQHETWQSNVLGPQVLAHACMARNIFFVHVGSGCVYSGDNDGKGYSESDPPNFFDSYYSCTKTASEQALTLLPVLQVRLRMPLDGIPGQRNFVTKITSYAKVISVPNSISVMEDFIPAVLKLIDKKATGLYNLVNPGAITHQEILGIYKQEVDPSYKYTLFSVEELHKQTAAQRSNCVLSTKKLEAEGITLPPVHEAVRAALKKYRTCIAHPKIS
ncbi:sugar nucleotide-binding protein [Candidatus Woesearchaeota archaeon]|nr:sugar nucleotide-binding protein [Candidatus Woesearchaeota archaeon]